MTLPFGNIDTRPFLPGAPGAAFYTRQLLPIIEIQGAGIMTRAQFAIESQPLVQTQSVPQAWDGITAGQFVSQGLTDPSNSGS